jgi:glycerate dehydrogenase
MHAVFLDLDRASCTDLTLSPLTEVMPDLGFYDQTSPEQLVDRIHDADIVLLDQCPLPRTALLAAAKLKLIALAATGYNHVDISTAAERGIAVCNVRDYCTQGLMQHVWSMILGLTHHLRDYQRLATDGTWSSGVPINVQTHSIRELTGRTLGIVGWGNLGRAVAKTGEFFGMNVVVASRPGSQANDDRLDLPALLKVADVVSLHCPLNDDTRGMIGAAELKLMKPDAVLINTARGALIDSAALAAALKAGRLGGAGIDVLPQEPPVGGDPLLDNTIPNLLITPHVAWAAREARQRSLDQLAANVRDFLDGGRSGRIV